MKIQKKIVALLLIASLATFTTGTAQASAGSTTTLDVSSDSTIIDVTITPAINLTIDPNTESVNSGTVWVVNNTKAPVVLNFNGFTPNDSNYLSLVSPDFYSSWSGLNQEESTKIALTLTAIEGWRTGLNSTVSSGTNTPWALGLGASSTASIRITQVNHGNSFAGPVTSSFSMDWNIGLE